MHHEKACSLSHSLTLAKASQFENTASESVTSTTLTNLKGYLFLTNQ